MGISMYWHVMGEEDHCDVLEECFGRSYYMEFGGRWSYTASQANRRGYISGCHEDADRVSQSLQIRYELSSNVVN
jgi:uncharacterized ParB-like nuclease family protein